MFLTDLNDRIERIANRPLRALVATVLFLGFFAPAILVTVHNEPLTWIYFAGCAAVLWVMILVRARKRDWRRLQASSRRPDVEVGAWASQRRMGHALHDAQPLRDDQSGSGHRPNRTV